MKKCNQCQQNIFKNSIKSKGFTIYIRPWCMYSQNALKMLNNIGAPYTCYNLDHPTCKHLEESLRVQLKPKRLTVPQVFFNGKYIGGHDDLQKYLRKGTF